MTKRRRKKRSGLTFGGDTGIDADFIPRFPKTFGGDTGVDADFFAPKQRTRRRKRRPRRSSDLEGLGRDIQGMSKDILDIGVGLALLNTMSGVARKIRSS